MKTLLTLLLPLLAFSLGAASVRAQEVGDTKEIIEARYGSPEISRSWGNRVTWSYGDGARFEFEDGRLIEFVPGKIIRKAVPSSSATDPEPARVVPPPTSQGKPAIQNDSPPAEGSPKRKPETITVGNREIRTFPIAMAVATVYGFLFLGLSQFPANRRTIGAVALALLFSIALLGNLIGLARAHGAVGLPEAIGLLIWATLFVGLCRGSSAAFGIYVILQTLGACVFALVALHLRSWLVLVPALGAAGSVAILFSPPVGGFLDRHRVAVTPPPLPPLEAHRPDLVETRR